MFLRVIRVGARISTSLLSMAEYYSIACMSHLFAEGHLGHFDFLAIVTLAAMHVHAHVFV